MSLELMEALKTFQDRHLSDLSKDAPCEQLENKIQVSWILFFFFFFLRLPERNYVYSANTAKQLHIRLKKKKKRSLLIKNEYHRTHITLQICLLTHDSKCRQTLCINVNGLRWNMHSCHALHFERSLNMQELLS